MTVCYGFAMGRSILIASMALAMLSVPPATAAVDRYLFERIHDDMRGDLLDDVVPVLNDFGHSKYTIAAAVLTAALAPDRMSDTGMLLGAGFAASALTSDALKRLAGRSRPLTPSDRHSMPSGHAAVAFSTATTLAHRYPRWRVAFYTVAGGVAFARVYLGRHYPGDVLVGAAIGVGMTRLALRHEQKILSISF